MPTLTAKAEEILAQAKQIDAYICSNGLPPPSSDHDSLLSLPPQYETVRRAMVDSTHTLKRLAQGTVGATTEMLYSVGLMLEVSFIVTNTQPPSSLTLLPSEPSTATRFPKQFLRQVQSHTTILLTRSHSL